MGSFCKNRLLFEVRNSPPACKTGDLQYNSHLASDDIKTFQAGLQNSQKPRS